MLPDKNLPVAPTGQGTSKPGLELSAIILAGGESRRMGRDKAWLEVGGRPLIQVAMETVRALGAREVFISGRTGVDYSAMECPVLFDLEPGFGPMGGIERGLHECSSSLLLVLAVDLPRVSASLLRKMLCRCDRLTGVVPRLNGCLEPLVAIYPKRCHVLAAEAIALNRRAARDFAEACHREHAVRTLCVSGADAGCFANWNRPTDVKASGN